jgi:uncharacterized protein involved in exopolysaccharide biosynthesis
MAWSFIFIFGGVVLATMLMPRQYEAEFKILVKNERADPLVTTDKDHSAAAPEVTEQDLNSEAELLKSRDLLEKVAVAAGTSSAEEAALYRATLDLEKKVIVEPIKKTKLIRVTYRSTSPDRARSTLQILSRLYFEKHLEVHRVAGAAGFFQAQTEQYNRQLHDTQAAMSQFAADTGVVEAPLAKEITVRKLNESEADVKQTRAAIAETEQRIAALENEEAATGPRLTTQVRTATNPYLMQQLKTTLLSLELKRTELLTRFSPGYRTVQEVETQISQAREALSNAENNPVREETTDRDATHEWLKSELAKSHADLQGLQAKVAATTQIVESYREQARKLNDADIAEQELARKQKTAEENYLLYSHKQEEARISDALDRQRIVNVSIAEPPMPPQSPAGPSRLLNLGLGLLLSILASLTIAIAADCLDRSFRTPREVEILLNVPVLAALPAECGAGEYI